MEDKNKKEPQKVKYDCECCGATSSKPGYCCGEPMKKEVKDGRTHILTT